MASEQETISVSLTHEQLRVIVVALQELPFRVAAPVIQSLEQQVTKQT